MNVFHSHFIIPSKEKHGNIHDCSFSIVKVFVRRFLKHYRKRLVFSLSLSLFNRLKKNSEL